MKIGGKHYLAQVQQHKRSSYARQISRRAIEAQRQAIRYFGEALFATQIAHGHESTRLTMQKVMDRLSGDMQTRIARLETLRSDTGSLPDQPRTGLDIRV